MEFPISKEADGADLPPLALYIHWPFCLAKCPYCDFNSHVRSGIAAEEWVAALLAEMRSWHEKAPDHRLASIFFGGGTPSLLPPGEVARLVEAATRLWPAADNLEVTLEANPTSSEAQKFRAFAAAGVNRLSLGVQALNDADLAFLGREHDVAQALAALDAARGAVPRVSFDLIYARKNQRTADWESELKQALALADGHVSLYQLTIEPGTVFAQKTATGSVFQAADDDSAQMYALTQDMCAAAGLPAYEVSNHARAGEECRHNLAYWNYQDYIGIGPGAHGRLTLNNPAHGRATLNNPAHEGAQKFASVTHRAPELWRRQVMEKGHGLEQLSPLAADEAMTEAFMMGLRLTRGIDKAAWRRRFGLPLEALLDGGRLAFLAQEGLVENTPERLRVTREGMLKLTAITERLLR